jgi:hypothetical protein
MEPGPQGLGSQGLRGGGGGGSGTRGAGGGLCAAITFTFFVILPSFRCFFAQFLEEN